MDKGTEECSFLWCRNSEEIARKTDFDTEDLAERITRLLISASQVERNSAYR